MAITAPVSSEPTRITLPDAPANNPSRATIPIPRYAGNNLCLIGANALHLFGDANVEVDVDPVSGQSNGFQPSSLAGVPYGATHVAFVHFGTGNALTLTLEFVSVVAE
jgi:hypothetical protein